MVGIDVGLSALDCLCDFVVLLLIDASGLGVNSVGHVGFGVYVCACLLFTCCGVLMLGCLLAWLLGSSFGLVCCLLG